MNPKPALGLIALMAMMVTACGDSGGEPTPAPSPSPTAKPSPTSTAVPTAAPVSVAAPELPEMEVDSVRTDVIGPFVLLREKQGARGLQIWIGGLEATAIAVKLREISIPRPLTQDLLNSMISDLGGVVRHVVITDLIDNTFYAKIVLSKNGTVMEVDSRPSDAIALSLRAGVPVYVEESVLKRASIVLGQMN